MTKKKQIKDELVIGDNTTNISENITKEDELNIKVPEITPKTIYDELVELIGLEIDLNNYSEYDDMYYKLKGRYFKTDCEDCKPRMLYDTLKIYIQMFDSKQINIEDYV